jgi:hypothetical protein
VNQRSYDQFYRSRRLTEGCPELDRLATGPKPDMVKAIL